jgi:outer membrane protein
MLSSPQLGAGLMALAGLLAPVPSFAQQAPANAGNPASAAPAPDWTVTIGAEAQWEPAYPGANFMRLRPFPAFDIEYKNRFFAKEDMLVGVYFVNNANWSAGLALQYDFTERETSDDSRLRGLQNVPATPRAKAFLTYTQSAFTFSTSAAQDIAGNREGLVVDTNATVTLPVGKKLYLTAGPGVTWTNGTYQQTFFGVTPSQSAASGLPVYDAHSGAASGYVTVEADYLITKSLIATVEMKFARLYGNSASSPITRRVQQNTDTLALTYTF